MGYTIIIFLYAKTNILGLGYLRITQDILGISHNVHKIHYLPHRAFWAASLCFLLVRVAWPRLVHPVAQRFADPRSQSLTEPPDEACRAQTATAMAHGFTS